MANKNILDVFCNNWLQNANKIFLRHKSQNSNKYLDLSYNDILQRCVSLQMSLQTNYGIAKGDRVAIFSFNKPEWVISDLTLMSLQAISVPLYPMLSTPAVKDILIASGSKVVIADTQEMVQAVTSVQSECPDLEAIIHIADDSYLDKYGKSFRSLSGFNVTSRDKEKFVMAAIRIPLDQIVTIVYTSGTTGKSKGVMLTHNNIASNVDAVRQAISITNQDTCLSFLPLAHVFERTVGYYCMLFAKGTICYAQNVNTLSEDFLNARPSIFVGVPLLYDRISDSVYKKARYIKKLLLKLALSTGMKYCYQGDRSLLTRLKWFLTKPLVINKIHAKLGGNLRMLVSGGAALSAKTNIFFESLDFKIIEGYGLTETSPVIACNRLEKRKVSSIGLPLDGQEIKLSNDKELLVKGQHVMQGYYNNPEQTAEIIDKDGWLHTGDLASIDEDGFIKIIGRKKEIIVLNNGKNVAPVAIEELLMADKYIEQACVYGDNHANLIALIVPNFEALDKKTIKKRDLLKFFNKKVVKLTQHLSSYERVRSCVLINKPFSVATGELTPTMKMKREVIAVQYAKEIDCAYSLIKTGV